MKSMYPGIPFSPATTITASIGAADTTIRVADGSVLPAAPNYMTIGTDETGEVVYYATKAGNLLSGCTRGVEGTAQAWNAGTIVGRNWNNIDYQNLIDNINELDKKKAARTGHFTAGNLAAIDENGDLSDSGLPAATLIDRTLSIRGKAADAKAVGDKLNTLTSGKVEKSQGASNAGKVLGIGEDGYVVPVNMAGGSTGGSAPADWSVNDPFTSGYVRNRTHWTEDGGETRLVNNKTVTASSEYVRVSEILIVGKKYRVTWDGVDYNVTAGTYTDMGGTERAYIGNYNVMIGDYSHDSVWDLPFVIQNVENGTIATDAMIQQGFSESATVSVYEVIEIVHQLGEKYIPDTIARKRDITGGGATPDWSVNDPTTPGYVKNRTHWEEVAEIEVFPLSDVAFDSGEGTLSENALLTEGKNYKVSWNGTDYTCTGMTFDMDGLPCVYIGNGSNFGLPDTGEPFAVMSANAPDEGFTVTAAWDYTLVLTSAPVGIWEVNKTVHKLDPKFYDQPNYTAAFYEPGHILNRTHYHEPEIVVLPTTTPTMITDDMATLDVSIPFIVGETYDIVIGTGSSENDVPFRLSAQATEISQDGITLGVGVKLQFQANDEGYGIVVSLYPEYIEQFGATTLISHFTDGWSISITKPEKLKQLDEKFIPDTIVRVGDFVTSDQFRSGLLSKMNNANPIGTGSFSMNRRPATHVGDYSHAEGFFTTASGYQSHAEGYYTTASGVQSHAEGKETIANGAEQHVQGRYNIEDNANKYAHIVGNGVAQIVDGEEQITPSNAHTLDWNGNAWFAGTVEGTALILKSPNGTRYQITVSDTGALTATALS